MIYQRPIFIFFVSAGILFEIEFSLVSILNTIYMKSITTNIQIYFRGGSRTAATSEMDHFVIIVNGWKSLNIITKSSTLDVAEVLDPPLRKIDTGTKKLPELSP